MYWGEQPLWLRLIQNKKIKTNESETLNGKLRERQGSDKSRRIKESDTRGHTKIGDYRNR